MTIYCREAKRLIPFCFAQTLIPGIGRAETGLHMPPPALDLGQLNYPSAPHHHTLGPNTLLSSVRVAFKIALSGFRCAAAIFSIKAYSNHICTFRAAAGSRIARSLWNRSGSTPLSCQRPASPGMASRRINIDHKAWALARLKAAL